MFCSLCLFFVLAKSDFEIDGLEYRILYSEQEINAVQVIGCSMNSSTTIIIPSLIVYNETEYKVISISSFSFASKDLQIENIYFPYTLEEIGNSAFSNLSELHHVGYINSENELNIDTLPPLLIQLNENVFYQCINLNIINVNNVINISSMCFYGCSKLSTVILPKVQIIGSSSFFNTSDLKSIELPSTLIEIQDDAFAYSSLVNVTGDVPNLKSINSFKYCFDLEKIPKLSAIEKIGGFDSCIKLKKVECGSPLTVIDEDCFHNCTSLTSFTTESKSYIIESSAFYYCQSLDNFDFTGVSSLGMSAFQRTNLHSVDLTTSKITKLLSNGFGYCPDLNIVKLSPYLKEYNDYCFYKTVIHSLYFPKTINQLNLKGPFLHSDIIFYEVIFDPLCDVILDSAFQNYPHLSRVVMPQTVKSLKNTFYGCSNLTTVDNFNGITETYYTFYNCFKLSKIDSFASLTEAGYSTFQNCYSLETLPEMTSIVKIDAECFKNCTNLKCIKIGTKCNDVSVNVFENCINLENFTSDLASCEISSGCFRNCYSLKYINFAHLANVYDSAFENCISLKDADFSHNTNIKYLYSGTFINCTNLKTISFPPNLQNVGSYCFKNCESITSISFTSFSIYIEESAFVNCIGLKEINFTYAPVECGKLAFLSCTSLESINIKTKSLDCNEIEGGAFRYCYSLRKVDFEKWPVSKIGEEAFLDCKLCETINITCGSKSSSLLIYDNAFNSHNIKNVIFSSSFSSISLTKSSFSQCINIKCVKCNEKSVPEISKYFDANIINSPNCPDDGGSDGTDDGTDDGSDDASDRKIYKIPSFIYAIIAIMALVIITLVILIILLVRRIKLRDDNLHQSLLL